MKKILLLDIENLHKTENELLTYLKQYSSIYLVYAKSPISFSLDGLVKLSPFIMNGKLKVLKMPKIGKDAADFGLTFIAGQLSTQVSAKEFSFDVMSNDHSMGYVVDLLKIAKFEAKIIHEKPLVSAHVINEVKAEQNVGELIFQYCEYLTKNAARPAKLESLLNSLKAILKVSDDVAKVLVELLKKHKIIRLDNSKIYYQDPSLQKFLKSNKQTAETAETIEQKLIEIRNKLLAHMDVNNHTPPKSLSGFTSILKRCLPEDDVINSLELLRKYRLIEVNSKRQVSYNPILLTNIIH